jgi:hypothetical protein
MYYYKSILASENSITNVALGTVKDIGIDILNEYGPDMINNATDYINERKDEVLTNMSNGVKYVTTFAQESISNAGYAAKNTAYRVINRGLEFIGKGQPKCDTALSPENNPYNFVGHNTVTKAKEEKFTPVNHDSCIAENDINKGMDYPEATKSQIEEQVEILSALPKVESQVISCEIETQQFTLIIEPTKIEDELHSQIDDAQIYKSQLDKAQPEEVQLEEA